GAVGRDVELELHVCSRQAGPPPLPGCTATSVIPCAAPEQKEIAPPRTISQKECPEDRRRYGRARSAPAPAAQPPAPAAVPGPAKSLCFAKCLGIIPEWDCRPASSGRIARMADSSASRLPRVPAEQRRAAASQFERA